MTKDTGAARRARASFAKQTLMRTIGARIVRVGGGECEIACTLPDGFGQQHGFAHAAILTALADTAGGYAAFSLIDPDEDVLASEFKINFLEPARAKRLVGTGTVVRCGRRLVICEIRAFTVEGRRRTLCAVGLQTVARTRKKG